MTAMRAKAGWGNHGNPYLPERSKPLIRPFAIAKAHLLPQGEKGKPAQPIWNEPPSSIEGDFNAVAQATHRFGGAMGAAEGHER